MNKNTKRLSSLCIASITYAFCLCALLTSCKGQEVDGMPAAAPTASSSEVAVISSATEPSASAAAEIPTAGSSSAAAALSAEPHLNEDMALNFVTMSGEKIKMNVPHNITIQELYAFIKNKDPKYSAGLKLILEDTVLAKDDHRLVVEFIKTENVQITIVINNNTEEIKEFVTYFVGLKEWGQFLPSAIEGLKEGDLQNIPDRMLASAKSLKKAGHCCALIYDPGSISIKTLDNAAKEATIDVSMIRIIVPPHFKSAWEELLNKTEEPGWLLVPFHNDISTMDLNLEYSEYMRQKLKNNRYRNGSVRELLIVTVLLHNVYKVKFLPDHLSFEITNFSFLTDPMFSGHGKMLSLYRIYNCDPTDPSVAARAWETGGEHPFCTPIESLSLVKRS